MAENGSDDGNGRGTDVIIATPNRVSKLEYRTIDQGILEDHPFRLDESFVNKYRNIPAPFGYNGLGEVAYRRTYSRIKDDGENEEWFETTARVVNGTYNMQRAWIKSRGLGWNELKGQESAREMYDRIFHLKFSPPGRGLWAMGSVITEERKVYAALNNCAFVSTDNLKDDLAAPFTFLMDASMLGVGVGFDTKGAGKLTVKGPDRRRQIEVYPIPDSREGWVDSVRILIESYFNRTPPIEFDYNGIRPKGQLIKGFGGHASGPEPLRDLHGYIKKTLDRETGRPISERTIVDLQNLIGKCVIAGNVRRTAEIAIGDPRSEEFLNLKDPKVNPERNADKTGWGWASNNSIFAEVGMDYTEAAERTRRNGEPGYLWLENMRRFGRMKDPPNNKDHRAKGGNPCLEQTLESYELCCLVETYPARAASKEDYLRTLKFAYLYAKTVTLGETHWPETNRVMLRNRRIGCSQTGIAQLIAKIGVNGLINWSEEGYDVIQKYDEIYSDWLCIPKSIKTTSVKPSGTVSLLAGASPGVHFPISRHYIRRVRIAPNSKLLPALQSAGYHIEQDVKDQHSLVVEFPVDEGEGVKSADKVSMWEQFALTALMQRHWADNQVSCTVKFDRETEGRQIKDVLDYFQYHLKGISLLPQETDTYPQLPYESITAKEYTEKMRKIGPLTFGRIREEQAAVEKFCDGASCEITPEKK